LPNHIILRQQVVLNLSMQQDACAVQNAVSALFKKEIPEIIEKVLDEIVPGKEIIRIDLLQLDLGVTDVQNFQQSFKERFEEEIRKAIENEKNQTAGSSNNSILPQAQSFREALAYFLENGTRAWYSTAKNLRDWEREMLQHFEEQDWKAITMWLKENNASPVIVKRLAAQFSDIFLKKLLAAVPTEIYVAGIDLYVDLFSAFNQLPLLRRSGLREIIWVNCFATFINSTPVLNQHQKINRLFSLVQSIATQSGVSVKESRKLKYLTFPGNNLLAIAIKKLVESISHESGKLESFEEANDVYSTQHFTGNIEYPKEEDSHTGNKEIKTKAIKYSNESMPGVEYVHCSGVVLLHPFLEMYFDELKLLNSRKFISRDACRKAVLLLHFLTTGATEVAEFDLTLQKIVCNLSAEETLPDKLTLTETERLESENLLQSVIDHWPPLNRTSVEGLRNTFLQREGILSFKENGWLLTIEQTTIDILLDKLPWGFSTIRLPWMDNILSVDWC